MGVPWFDHQFARLNICCIWFVHLKNDPFFDDVLTVNEIGFFIINGKVTFFEAQIYFLLKLPKTKSLPTKNPLEHLQQNVPLQLFCNLVILSRQNLRLEAHSPTVANIVFSNSEKKGNYSGAWKFKTSCFTSHTVKTIIHLAINILFHITYSSDLSPNNYHSFWTLDAYIYREG